MKRILGVICAAVLMVVMAAAPASANIEGGIKGFIWPAHCGTEMVLMMDTHQDFHVTVINGRIDFSTCASKYDRAWGVYLQRMTLWGSKNGAPPVKKREILDRSNYNVYNFSGILFTTNSITCEGDVAYWIEAVYIVQWYSDATNLRDNNSNVWSNVC